MNYFANELLKQGCIKLIWSDKIFCSVIHVFRISNKQMNNAFLWTFCSSKTSEKCIMVFAEILNSTTVYNIDNKKCFLSSKSAY